MWGAVKEKKKKKEEGKNKKEMETEGGLYRALWRAELFVRCAVISMAQRSWMELNQKKVAFRKG